MHPALVHRARRVRAIRRGVLVAALVFGALPLVAGWTYPGPPDDVPLMSLEAGEGRSVLLLHGAFGTSDDWSEIWSRLHERYRTVAIDRPGHGRSSTSQFPAGVIGCAEAAHHVITTKQLGPTVVVGYSYGAKVALALAVLHPEDVSALVLGASSQNLVATFRYYAVLRLPVYGTGVARLLWPLMRVLKPGVWLYENPKIATSAAEDALGWPEAKAMLLPRYGEISAPVYVVNGTEDPLTPAGDPGLPGTIRELHVTALPGRGHLWIKKDPQPLLDAIEAAVARTTPRGGAGNERIP